MSGRRRGLTSEPIVGYFSAAAGEGRNRASEGEFVPAGLPIGGAGNTLAAWIGEYFEKSPGTLSAQASARPSSDCAEDARNGYLT
jgi:hypothetical protein